MSARAGKALLLAALVTALFAGGVWGIREFFKVQDLPLEQKVDFVVDSWFSGTVEDPAYRRHLRSLQSRKDPAVAEVLAAIESRPAVAATPEGRLMAAIVATRAGRTSRASLEDHLRTTPVDSFRFPAIQYWGYRSIGSLEPGGLEETRIAALKRLGRSLQQRDMPFRAAELFEACIRAQGDSLRDPELVAWYGSALTKRALFVESSIEKIRMVKEGVNHLDRSIYENPDWGILRYIRANTYASLPPVFKKAPMLKADIEFMIDHHARNQPVKVWSDSGRAMEVPVDTAQLRGILDKSLPLFSDDPSFAEKLKATLKKLES